MLRVNSVGCRSNHGATSLNLPAHDLPFGESSGSHGTINGEVLWALWGVALPGIPCSRLPRGHINPQPLNAIPSSNACVRDHRAGSQSPGPSPSAKAAPGCLDSERFGMHSKRPRCHRGEGQPFQFRGPVLHAERSYLCSRVEIFISSQRVVVHIASVDRFLNPKIGSGGRRQGGGGEEPR